MGERHAERDHRGVQEKRKKERKKSNTKINNECELDTRNNRIGQNMNNNVDKIDK
jgi:hypothetical protein